MDRKTAILLAALIVLMFPAAAYAEPTVTGPTGLLVIPTADTVTMSHMWVGINWLDLDTIVMPDQSLEGGTAWTALLTGGLSDNFELGIGYMLQEESDNGVLFNGKYRIVNDDEEQWYPAVALGATVSNFSGNTNSEIYLVGSKFFWVTPHDEYSGSIHAGIDYMKLQGNDWKFEYFLGADVALTEEIVAIAEFSQDNDAFGDGFSWGVRYFFNKKTTAQAGLIDGNLAIGGSYIF